MKLLAVVSDNRKRRFEVKTRRMTMVFPYARAVPSPSASDPVIDVFVDPDLGNEGFTYRLTSGVEGSVHVDSVLEYNEDPSYMAELTLHRLTVEAKRRFQDSGLSAREVARLIGTSPAQLYRLLDPTNFSKSVRQLISLLYVLGAEVDLGIKDRPRRQVG